MWTKNVRKLSVDYMHSQGQKRPWHKRTDITFREDLNLGTSSATDLLIKVSPCVIIAPCASITHTLTHELTDVYTP